MRTGNPTTSYSLRYLPIRSMRQIPSTSMRRIDRTVLTGPTVRTVLTTAARVVIAHLATAAHPLPALEATARRVLRAAPPAAIAFISRLALPAGQVRALQRAARPMSRKATWSPVCRPRCGLVGDVTDRDVITSCGGQRGLCRPYSTTSTRDQNQRGLRDVDR